MKQLVAKEKARRNTCDVWFSSARRSRVVPEEVREDWCEEAVEDGLGPCESLERTSRWQKG